MNHNADQPHSDSKPTSSTGAPADVSPPGLTIIVATDRRRGIGVANTLPWRLPEDMAFFKRTTSGHPVLMGRKTFDSIGRALPNRRNIVITRNRDWSFDGVETAPSLEAAAAMVDGVAAFLIGGAQIYAAALPLPITRRLLVTEIDADFDCDAFFPAIDGTLWKQLEKQTFHSEKAGFDYSFVTYARN